MALVIMDDLCVAAIRKNPLLAKRQIMKYEKFIAKQSDLIQRLQDKISLLEQKIKTKP
ncbi:MAG: hypothetical protein ACXABY_07860 [Candidatus Thorarchaeota archaeon]|jgi:hypothetical protein